MKYRKVSNILSGTGKLLDIGHVEFLIMKIKMGNFWKMLIKFFENLDKCFH